MEKNKCNNFEKPKKEKDELNQEKIIDENKFENKLEKNIENIIIAKFNVINPNSKVRIMNSNEINKEELSEKFDIFIDDILIPFSWEYQFS